MNITAKDFFGVLLVIVSIFDAIKYSLQAKKIRQTGTAKSQSRKFINIAILSDIIKLIYGLLISDYFIAISSVLAIVCMIDLWYTTYLFYPYRRRGLIGFKRPGIIIYLINSIIPNQIRKRL